jgi:hypothetical protein
VLATLLALMMFVSLFLYVPLVRVCVSPRDTRDSKLEETFHPFGPAEMMGTVLQFAHTNGATLIRYGTLLYSEVFSTV